jgi:hypothetical protein
MAAVTHLKIRRHVHRTDPAAGFGLAKIKQARPQTERRLAEFDAAALMRGARKKK